MKSHQLQTHHRAHWEVEVAVTDPSYRVSPSLTSNTNSPLLAVCPDASPLASVCFPRFQKG